jgi:hypothetical protein
MRHGFESPSLQPETFRVRCHTLKDTSRLAVSKLELELLKLQACTRSRSKASLLGGFCTSVRFEVIRCHPANLLASAWVSLLHDQAEERK